jgi:hypothetical protein
MEDVFFYLSLISYIFSGGFLITSIILFITLNIKNVIKDVNGSLEQKQIEEIRDKNYKASQLRGKVNVFEELERKAKPRKSNTSSLQLGQTTEDKTASIAPFNESINPGTTVLQQSSRVINPNFIIEKSIMYVSTEEVM